MELLPGLPYDVALECLIRVPFDQLSLAASVCRGWKAEIELPAFLRRRRSAGLAKSVLVFSQARVRRTLNSQAAKHLVTPAYRLTLCDPETGSWSDLPLPPGFPDGLPIFCHLVGVGSELVVMGGCDPVTWQVSNSVFIYNFISGEWRPGADIPGGHRLFFGCAASDLDRTVYVAGGHDDEKTALRSAMMYDVAKDEWVQLPDMAKERDECKAVFHRGKFHVIGGYPTETQGGFQKDAEAFDITTWRWDHREDLLQAATCPRTCVGGGDGTLYTCQEGNVMAGNGATWQVVGGLPAEVFNVAYLTAWKGKLVAVGCAKFGEPHRSYVMDLKSCRWTKVESPEEYSSHVQSGCCLVI